LEPTTAAWRRGCTRCSSTSIDRLEVTRYVFIVIQLKFVELFKLAVFKLVVPVVLQFFALVEFRIKPVVAKFLVIEFAFKFKLYLVRVLGTVLRIWTRRRPYQRRILPDHSDREWQACLQKADCPVDLLLSLLLVRWLWVCLGHIQQHQPVRGLSQPGNQSGRWWRSAWDLPVLADYRCWRSGGGNMLVVVRFLFVRGFQACLRVWIRRQHERNIYQDPVRRWHQWQALLQEAPFPVLLSLLVAGS